MALGDVEVLVGLLPEDGRPVRGVLGWLGTVEYQTAWELQARLAADRRAAQAPDMLLFVEHPPVYTLGRMARAEHVLVGADELARLGAQLLEVDRGGDVTFHGPGQLVGYPIVDLLSRGRDVHRYLRTLEEAIIRTLAEYGIEGERQPPHTGVWCGESKIAAIGVKVSRGVTLHGFALNVTTDLSYFDRIIPCGIQGRGVTSLNRLLARPLQVDEVGGRLARHLGVLLGIEWVALDARGAGAEQHDRIVAAGRLEER